VWNRVRVTIEGASAKWDFFVSYTQADRSWAEWIAWELEEQGHRVLVQAWDFVPGTSWVQGMQSGVTHSARMIALLSPTYLSSVYGQAEWQAVWGTDPLGNRRKLLTVRVADCDRPGLLGPIVGIDVFGVPEAKAQARLRDMVTRATTRRAKPGEKPSFPTAQRAIPHEARFPGALPQVWNIPARNPNFTGRASALTALAAELAASGTMTVTSVRGMGGVGKTQLANEYAHLHATHYDLVWWIAAEEPALIADQFARLAAAMGLEPGQDAEMVRLEVHQRLRETPGWLLIFDNADTADDIRGWLPPSLLSPGAPGHVLVTTRRDGFTSLGAVHDLDVVDEVEAMQILRARVPQIGDEVAGQIAAELGRLPLALEQASAYITRSRRSPGDYLQLLRTRAQQLYGQGKVASREETIATLWTLSFDRIGQEEPAALQLLAICAYLAPVPIPLDLFTAHPDQLSAPLDTKVTDDLDFTDVVATIVDYSLAKRELDGLLLHRLVQGALRLRYPVAGQSRPTAGQDMSA
jgi:hypothetical protein